MTQSVAFEGCKDGSTHSYQEIHQQSSMWKPLHHLQSPTFLHDESEETMDEVECIST